MLPAEDIAERINQFQEAKPTSAEANKKIRVVTHKVYQINVLTLAMLTKRLAYGRQFKTEQIAIIGMEETRCRETGITEDDNFIRVASAAARGRGRSRTAAR